MRSLYLIICATALTVSQVKAAVIFSDGFESPPIVGFSNGSFSPGWTLNEPNDPNQIGLRSGFAFEGSQVAQFNATGSPVGASVSRSISTNIGEEYTISLMYRSFVGNAGVVKVDFGASTLTSPAVAAADEWYLLTFSHIASSTSTLLTLTDVTTDGGSSDLMLDALTISSVPEPSVLGLLGLGTSAMLLRRNRKVRV